MVAIKVTCKSLSIFYPPRVYLQVVKLKHTSRSCANEKNVKSWGAIHGPHTGIHGDDSKPPQVTQAGKFKWGH